jgi:hypothetical protein
MYLGHIFLEVVELLGKFLIRVLNVGDAVTLELDAGLILL